MTRSQELEELAAEREKTLILWVLEAFTNAAFWTFIFWLALR